MISGCSSKDKKDDVNSLNEETMQEENASVDLTARRPFLLCTIDYAQKEGDTLSLSLSVYLINGSFREDLNTSQIEFGGDLADAADVVIEESSTQSAAKEISFVLENSNLDPADLNLNASLLFKAGSILDEDGNAAQDLMYEHTLTFNDDEKFARENFESSYYPDTKTLVFKITGNGPAYGSMSLYTDYLELFSPYDGSYDAGADLSYIIFDFSDADSKLNDAYDLMATIFCIASDSQAKTYILNMDYQEELEEFYDASIYQTGNEANYAFYFGDTSKLSFKEKRIAADIDELLESGTLIEQQMGRKQ
jgi:hypothetical protein